MATSPFDVEPREVEDICSPPRSPLFNSAAERSKQHDLLVSRGLHANKAGSIALAAQLFWHAAQLEPRRSSTLISYINMRLKQGDAALAAACYLRLMEVRELTPHEWELVQRKLHEANRAMVLSKQRHTAAATVQRLARGRAARSAAAARAARAAAATALQRAYLRRARLRPAPFISQLSFVRLPRKLRAREEWSAARTLVLAVHPASAHPISAQALAPFAADERAYAGGGGLLHFDLTTRSGTTLHCCSLPLAAEEAGTPASTSPPPRYVLVLISTHRLPLQMAECAYALLPLALAAAAEAAAEGESEGAEGEAPEPPAAADEGVCVRLTPREVGGAVEVRAEVLPRGGVRAALAALPHIAAAAEAAPEWPDGEAAPMRRELQREARRLLAQPGPRALPRRGQPLLVAGQRILLQLPAIAGESARDSLPPPVEPLGRALAPLSSAALLRLFAALLLEQKVFVVSAQPARLTPFVHAATSLLFPLRWRHISAPLLPPSHAAVASAPFPFILGIPAHAESYVELGRLPPAPDAPKAAPGEMWVLLDHGRRAAFPPCRRGARHSLLPSRRSCVGAPLAPLPERIATRLEQRIRHCMGGGAAADGGLQSSFLWATAALLVDAARLSRSAQAARPAALSRAILMRVPEGLDKLDVSLREITSKFVERQSLASRPFARKLVETSAFKSLLESMAVPAEHWPRWLRFFEAHALSTTRSSEPQPKAM
ncbi:hypothetical protein AB1Y20_015005 [Prymnesium parvum]|uniref:cDENN domain-containing protein n=1 Tax=Prymnesium parvum TaxID=97485 RepID=A0AB34JZB6_PRYPA